MKRIFSILLLFIYTSVICGITVTMHYCGGRLASLHVSLGDEHPECPCGSKKMKNNCCKNKTIHFQFKAEHKAQYLTLFKNLPAKYDTLAFFLVPGIGIPDFYQLKESKLAHPPPLLASSRPSYLLNRTFRI